MKDLTELRNVLCNLKYLCKCRAGSYKVNHHKRSNFEIWKTSSHLWKEILSDFSSEEELVFYLCRPRLSREIYCQNCGKQLTFEQIKSGRKSCSSECKEKISHSEEWSRKYRENWKNKTPEELAEIKSHLEKSMLEKYGVRHNWCNGKLRDKEKQTWLEKYGVDHPWKSKKVRKEIVDSMFRIYGKDNYSNRKKARQTCEERGSYKIVSEKNKIAWGNKTQEEIDARTKKTSITNLEKYGTITPWYLDEGREKTKKTCLQKYGVEHYSKADVVKEKKRKTCNKHYGVDSPFQSEVVVEKCRQNNRIKYGYDFPSQSPEFHSKSRKKYVYDGLQFDSSDELYFYIYHKEILKDDVQPGNHFEYYFNNHKMIYYCDFLVQGENVEIKGNQYIKDGRLYFPYRNKHDVDWVRKQK